MITTEKELDILMKACFELHIKDELICSCLYLFPKNIDEAFVEQFKEIFMKYRRLLAKKIFKVENATLDKHAIRLTLEEMK